MKLQLLSIIVPAYNEEPALEESIRLIADSAKKCSLPCEIIVVNDGSTDQTAPILESLAKKVPNLIVIHHDHNKMIGGAFLSGLSRAGGTHVILIPVDNPLDAVKLQEFIDRSENCDIVVGVRSDRVGYRRWMQILSKIYWLFCVVLFGVRLRDLTWICMYDRKKISALSLKFSGIAIFPEILVKAAIRKYTAVEIECPMIERKSGKATVGKLSRLSHLFFETIRLWRHVHFEKW